MRITGGRLLHVEGAITEAMDSIPYLWTGGYSVFFTIYDPPGHGVHANFPSPMEYRQ